MPLPPKHCPECGEEYVHSVLVCAHCGVALVLSGEPVAARELPPAASLRRIRTATLSWGRGFSARLVAAGIAHRVELEPDSDDSPAANQGARLCGVFVREEDVAAAVRLDQEHLRSEIPDLPEELDLAARGEGLCPACDEPADLTAAECPGCGLAFRDAAE